MTFKVIQMEPRTFSWWRDEQSEIDLDPVYQRKGNVWTAQQKQFLLDSIFNGYDIPKIYVADFTFLNSDLNKGKKKYAVIDGKQRLTTIYDFFDDKIGLPKGFIYEEDPALKLEGFRYSDLLKNYPKIARRFENSSFTVMSVITDDESRINELFVRLNSSKPLSGAEIRNAMIGPLPDLIREIVETKFFRENISFSTNRGQDKNLAAKLLLLEHRGSIVDTKKSQLDALVKEIEDTPNPTIGASGGSNTENEALEAAIVETAADAENPNIERSALRVKSVLARMNNIFVPVDPLLRQSAQIVIFYWLIRGIDPSRDAQVRPFMLRFDQERAAQKGGGEDSELAEFELMARTVNDASSIRVRFRIIRDRFARFTLD